MGLPHSGIDLHRVTNSVVKPWVTSYRTENPALTLLLHVYYELNQFTSRFLLKVQSMEPEILLKNILFVQECIVYQSDKAYKGLVTNDVTLFFRLFDITYGRFRFS